MPLLCETVKADAAICPICSSKRMYYAFSVQRSRLVECHECGHMMLHPPPDKEALGRIYNQNYWLLDDSDEERQRFSMLKQATALLYLDLAKRSLGRHGGRLLEIGSGAGDLLAAAADLGYDVTGVEFSQSSCVRAQERLGNRGRVICGDIHHLQERNYYDVCVIADVVEHVENPREFLQRVYELLRTGGIVIVATPSLESWSARLLKNRWMEFKTEHLHYFRPETLHSLLFQSGLEPIGSLPGRKWLSLEYIVDHFVKYPVPVVSSVLRAAARLLPKSARIAPFRITASGIVSVASKVPRAAGRKISILVPAFNEAATLAPLLESVLAKNLEGLEKEIILVESNSTDGTREIALRYENRPGVKLVLEDKPRGKGHAVRTALAHATGDYILIQDADQEYDIEDYDVLIEPLTTGRKAFILGSRHGGRTWKVRQFEGQPWTGLLLNFGHWFFKTVVNIVFGLRLADPFTMYKVFRRDCIAGVIFECDHFDFDYELLIKIVRNGYRPVEIPVNYRSRSFSEGKKVSVLRDPWSWMRAIVKFRLQDSQKIRSWTPRLTPARADAPAEAYDQHALTYEYSAGSRRE